MRMHWNETPNKEGWIEHFSGQRECLDQVKSRNLAWVMAGARKLVPRTPELSMRWPWASECRPALHWLRTRRAVRREKLGSAQNGSFRYQENRRKLGFYSTAELSVPDLADITRKLAQCENKSAKRFLPLSNSPWRVDFGGAYGICKRSTKQHF